MKYANEVIQGILFCLLSFLPTNEHEHFCVNVPKSYHRYISEHSVGISIDELRPMKPAEMHPQ